MWSKWSGLGAALVLLVVLARPASAQTTPIFRMDCGTNGSVWPSCGFDFTFTEHEGRYFSRTRLPGGSPSGRDAVQLDMIPSTTTDGEFEYGWIFSPRATVAQGAVRYFRYRFRIRSPLNWASINGRRFGTKLIILGNTCERSPYSPTRVIHNFDTPGGGVYDRVNLATEQNIAGYPSLSTVGPVAPDVWHHVQIKIVSSASATSADGMLYVYLDQNNASESTPSGQSAGAFNLKTLGWATPTCSDAHVVFGGTIPILRSGGSVSFQLADFEYDDEFDRNWHLAGSSGTLERPAPPRNVVIIRGAAVAVLPLGALATLIMR